ncbi:MAG TPA: AIR synthase-related protein [Candidatus Paceibacterota bacterium]|nr:AIR synthase-related protein [Candidatus Paceibacterota bacterium]
MISRIYVVSKATDSREKLYLKSWKELGLKGKPSSVTILDSYIIDSQFSKEQLEQVGNLLTHRVLENFSINEIPAKRFNFALEIGFLPGVTDNAGNTAKETILDFFHLPKETDLAVYTSRVFLIKGKLGSSDLEKISQSLHNPLIERSYIATEKEIKKEKTLPQSAPVVILEEKTPVVKVSLNVSDEELINIGKEGIVDPDGMRRGPLALDLESMKVIQKFFAKEGRDPTDIELESLAQTWSEHCKHTIFANPIDEIKDGLYKTYIKGATNLIRKRKGSRDFCVSVFSDNSGAIAFDDHYLITHKVETHNSPSALDPFGGAITGIVGVNRDTVGFGLGAKPVGNVYGFCVGNPHDTRPLYRGKNKQQKMLSTRRIMDGVIRGINVGGNCSGIPTHSGFIKYEDRYRGKPLVFAGTVGIIERKGNGKYLHEKEAQAGDYIVVIGGRVGADGIHGATFSSVTMDSTSPATAVQIGDPITQKKLSDAIVKEARAMDLYTSITDNGAGGISCSVAEMAKECGGAEVDLEKVPLKYLGLRPWEIWISESQERMTLSVPKKKWEVFRRLMESRGVEATIIGEFTNSGRCRVKFNGKKIMDMPMDFLHDGLPVKELRTTFPSRKYVEPKLPAGFARTKVLENLLSELNIGSFAFISEQYDHEVQASSVLKPLSGAGRINTDAQIFRPVHGSKKGAVLSSSLYPFYGDISAYHMSACAIDTAIRNVITAGGSLSTLAILDNFCWCSSNESDRLGELKEAVRACYDYAVGYGTPFISGKDSMFNDFKGYDEKGNPLKISIPPTLLISAIGVMDDVLNAVSPEWKVAGDNIYVLGETHDELGASEYFRMLAKESKNPNAIGNDVPKVDFEKNIKIYSAFEEAVREGIVSSAISVTSGGLATALAKASVGGMLGCNVSLENLHGHASSIDSKLFSESQGRILVSIAPFNMKRFEKIMRRVPVSMIGTVSKDKKFIVTDQKKKVIESNTDKLHKNYHKFSESCG